MTYYQQYKSVNIYHRSDELIDDLRNGRIPLGSIVHLQWPSGAEEAVRFHGWNYWKGVMVGCNMGWDNGATEWYDLSIAFLSKIEKPKEKKCPSCNKLVAMWHKHSMFCKPEKHYPLVATPPNQPIRNK